MTDVQQPKRRAWILRLWDYFWRPTARYSLAVLLIAGFIAGILFWGGFHWAMEVSNTEAFCTGCHEMRDNVFKELQQTVHYTNRTGVRAVCSDCHVPKDWFYKIRRKIQASNELFHHLLGSVDTPEKFEKHRFAMASRVWASMKATDSRECRNCHSLQSMNPHKQSQAAKIMFDANVASLTCIDCHRGIAHKLPKDPDEPAEQTSDTAPAMK